MSTAFFLRSRRQRAAAVPTTTFSSRTSRRSCGGFFFFRRGVFVSPASSSSTSLFTTSWTSLSSSLERNERDDFITRRHRRLSTILMSSSSSEQNENHPDHPPEGESCSDDPPPHKKPNFNWTVCDTCHGWGKISRPLTRKQKLKRARTDTENTQTSSCRWEPCSKCAKSGLIAQVTESLSKKSDNNDNEFTVAIVGGGLGGLALCLALQHRKIQCQVFERDLHFHQRSQGYGLTLQQAAPQLQALGISNLGEDGRTSTKHIVHDVMGKVQGQWGLRQWGTSTKGKNKSKNKRQNVHIARQALRRILYDHIPDPSVIQWGHKLTSLKEIDGNRKLELSFAHGKTVTADLVVGADGIRSQVRHQFCSNCKEHELRYLNCIVILGICQLQGNLPSEMLELQNEQGDVLLDGATVFQTADGSSTRLYSMPFSKTHSMWQLSFSISEDKAIEISRQGPEALKALALQQCGTWHAPIPQLLEHTPATSITGYPVYDRPILTQTVMRENLPPSVTLLGDAAHPMSPFKGQGANQALLDALSLARVLYRKVVLPQKNKKTDNNSTSTTTSHHDLLLQDALQEFQAEMIQRTTPKVQASADAAEFLHSSVAIQSGNVTRGGVAMSARKNKSQPERNN